MKRKKKLLIIPIVSILSVALLFGGCAILDSGIQEMQGSVNYPDL